jgi:hypothetical protein
LRNDVKLIRAEMNGWTSTTGSSARGRVTRPSTSPSSTSSPTSLPARPSGPTPRWSSGP